eukprot:gnl/TRDRNA2_/TRDRNA2_159464_c1_seq1.p1 gnl/TRDRNA2_/TRDRNA2_159464_c1~~gnl/TRDRNA2_/TRDRNA2_159464_c1_seq1.p1  ORF type:complete len:339 (+),score=62.92 gnl/TRDRNA2_/TRDRNA2_159464_c1_seq1:137-1018(+)
MAADQRGLPPDTPEKNYENGLQVGFGTSLKCADHTVPAGKDPLPEGTVRGIDLFVTRLSAFGNELPGGTCAKKVDCSLADMMTQPVCDAGNNYIDLKNKLLTQQIFRCDVFESPVNSNFACDVKDMTWDGSKWVNDCLKASGDAFTTNRKAVSCTLPEFVVYVQQWADRMETVFKRIDQTVPQVTSSIATQLHTLVNDVVVEPVDRIITGANCQFLGARYKELVDGLCLQGINGIHAIAKGYVVTGILTTILMLVTYVIWRRSIDNVNSWKSLDEGGGAAAPAAEAPAPAGAA